MLELIRSWHQRTAYLLRAPLPDCSRRLSPSYCDRAELDFGRRATIGPPASGPRQELAAIRRLLVQIRGGTGGVIVLEGTAGAGKTRLNDKYARIAAELSFRVGRGGTESVTRIELGALFDALFEGDSPLADPRALHNVRESRSTSFGFSRTLSR